MLIRNGFAAAAALTLALGACRARTGSPAAQEAERSSGTGATISPDLATRRALARVPGGTVVSSSLEEERGTLLYSLDIRPAQGSGVEEVQVDARTGAVLSQTHESVAEERREADHDAAAKTR